MQQIEDWLKQLGMSEYAERLADNKTDVSVLPYLTDQDLKEIDVPLGHRRKMLAAIAELGIATQPTTEPAGKVEPKLQEAGERRQVTVMFSDLVGSTALSARMDPEDLREVISAYQKCVAETVRRFGGFVAKYMGDGVLVYFGYPQAHEDDPERAVRAGLELVAAVGSLKTSVALQTRIGIATGLVVVGDLIGSGAAQEQAVVGETPNLAARLQSIAEPDTVVIAEETRKLLGNLFELEDLGPNELKGIVGPVRAWAALRTSSVEGRFEAMHASGLTALVGREEELELLLRRWSRAKDSEGQVVLLSGEPGIGKSRLTAALLERLAGEPHTRLRYFCSPQHTDSALYPIIGQMQRAAGPALIDTPQVKLDKLDALLVQTSTSIEDAALFAGMLSLPNDGRYPALELVAEQRRQKTIEALVAQMAALSRQRPVLMIFEDAHWTDPTSLEVFGRVVDRIKTLRVLLIVTFRPEFAPPWIGRPYVTALTINRLGERDVGAIIDRVVGNKPLPESIRQDIMERYRRHPLIRRGNDEGCPGSRKRRRRAEYRRRNSLGCTGSAGEPARLADGAARPARSRQGGSADRRGDWPRILARSVGCDGTQIGEGIGIGVGPAHRSRFAVPAGSVAARELFIQACSGPGRRLQYPIARAAPRAACADCADSQPELLARHCTEAGLIEQAAAFWGKAGQRSLIRSALVEATEQLKRALAQIASLPATPALRRAELELQVALKQTSVTTLEWLIRALA